MAKGICSIEDCDRPIQCRGWCTMHYQRVLSNGSPADRTAKIAAERAIRTAAECAAKFAAALPCSAVSCDDPGLRGDGLCKRHWYQRYYAQRRTGGRTFPGLPGEAWRPVLGYEGVYDVSNRGRVRRLNKAAQPLLVLKPLYDVAGRVVAHLNRDSKRRVFQVSVLVLEAFVSPRPAGLYALHNDGVVTSNRVDNLRWDTPKANVNDMVRHGTAPWVNRDRCIRDHLLVAPNLVKAPAAVGHRQCYACDLARGTVRHSRRKGIPLPDLREEADRRYAEIMGVKHDGGSP